MPSTGCTANWTHNGVAGYLVPSAGPSNVERSTVYWSGQGSASYRWTWTIATTKIGGYWWTVLIRSKNSNGSYTSCRMLNLTVKRSTFWDTYRLGIRIVWKSGVETITPSSQGGFYKISLAGATFTTPRYLEWTI